jgi:glycosyltransferase involved in cell wall biosynthesis
MDLSQITPLILTFNEEPNIGDTLDQLSWAKHVVVIDSFSSDATIDIANRFENVRVIQRRFDDHTSQWNYGLEQIETGWALTLDADYRCPPTFADEIRSLDHDCDAYVATFTYCIAGKPLRGSLYPPRAVLFRRQCCRYIQDGHTQSLVYDHRRTRRLDTKLLHDDRKPLSRWLAAQAKYAKLEARKLRDMPYSRLGWKDRIRSCYVAAPTLTFFYCLFVKALIFDGRAGLYYTLQRVYAELLLGLALLNYRLRPEGHRCTEPVRDNTSGGQQQSIGSEEHELSHTRN